MKTEIKFKDGKTFGLTSRLVAEGVDFLQESGSPYHNKFKVTVRRTDAALATVIPVIRAVSFDFYGSQADFEKGVKDLTEPELKLAFRNFLEDALSGSQDFEEFCREMGMSNDSIRALNIWKSCKKSMRKAERLGMASMCFDALNELSEMGIE